MTTLALIFLWVFNLLILPRPLTGGLYVSEQKDALVFYFLLLAGLLALYQSGRSGQSVFQGRTLRTLSDRSRASRALMEPAGVLGLAVGAYGLWILLTVPFSSQPGFALFGYSGTEFGGLMIIACLLLAWVYSHTSIRQQVLVNSLLSISLVMVFFELLEALGYHPLHGLTDVGNVVYPASLIGFRQYLGGWWSVMSLLPVFMYRHRRTDRRFWLWLGVIAIGLALCSNSAASLGVLLGLGSWMGWSALYNRSQIRVASGVLLAFVLALLVLPPVFTKASQALGHDTASFKNYGATNTLSSRVLLWKSAWRASLERPVVGWGAETFIYQTFPHLSNAEMTQLAHIELGLPDGAKVVRSGFSYVTYNPSTHKYDPASVLYIWPHNIILDELYSRGFVGLILFLIVIILTLRYAYYINRLDFIYFIFVVLPYGVYLMAWFFTSMTTPFYFMVIGLALAALKTAPPPFLSSPTQTENL